MHTRSLMLAVGVSLALAGTAQAESVEVTASALNVRSGASTGYGKVGLIHRGQAYPVLARSGSWVKIHLGTRSGWSHGNYLRTSSRGVFTVTASRLNVRTGASTRYRVLGTLSSGTPVVVAANVGSWRKIHYNGRTAYVYGSYLRAQGGGGGGDNRPRSAAGFIQLASSGPGWRGYYSASRRWGTPAFIYGVERVARRWKTERPSAPRISVGDISAENGGYLSGHVSHRLGVDGDFRPIRNDGGEGPVTIHQSAYSRTLTRHLLNLFESELRVRLLLFNDTAIHTPHRQSWPNHANHFHVRTWE